MKILVVNSAILPDPDKQSPVDHWRIYRPMRELAKHVDWQIDHAPFFIPAKKKYKDKPQFTEEEINEAANNIKDYDIVFASYHPDPTAFTMLQALRNRSGVQFVMDCDDDMFAINPDNPFWMKNNHEQVYWMQRMIALNPWITTPSPVLARRFRERRPGLPHDSVVTIPNYISDDYQHPGFDNMGQIIIGYMGGSSHYFDLHDSGVLEAIQKLMHEDKRVRFRSIGMFLDTYLPKARTTFDLGKRGSKYLTEVFPDMNFDISIAPILPNLFNEGKSNIKWQESTRAGSTFVASAVGPYAGLKDGVNALLVKENNTEQWYKALKKLVDSPKLRDILITNAKKDVMLNWTLENERNWSQYKELFERVNREKGNVNANHRTVPGLFAGKTRQSGN